MKKIIVILAVIASLGLIIFVSGCNPAPKSDAVKAPTGQNTPPPVKQGADTVVPKGMTPKDYVTEHYKYVLAGKFDKAFEMLPAATKAQQPKNDYITMQSQVKITSYEIKDVQDKGDTQSVTVNLMMPGYDKGWGSVWVFNKTSKGWVVASKQSAEQ
jgi:hypothetical protein